MLREVRESGFAFASQQMEARLCTLAVPVKDIGGNFVAGLNVILQGRLVTAGEMAARFAQPLQDAASELGSLLLPELSFSCMFSSRTTASSRPARS